MSILGRIFPSQQNKAAETTETMQSDVDGCVKCGKLVFNFDKYFQDYICDNCGWTISTKPNGKIKINTIPNAEDPPGEEKDKNTSRTIPVEEMNKIIQEYGSAVVHNAPPPGGIADISMLPYPKSKIKEAIIQALHVADGPEMVSSLKGAYTKLSDWQEDVGEQSIGIDLSTFGMILDPDERAEAYLEQESQLEKWKDIIDSDSESLREDLEKLGL